ncbi:MAG TPA: pimeloyl-ACP methyl ester esterase BioH [Gallionella sp.]|nr:pimeloyl-ACP methyl ester esterase BioH [Gallionella sp.]
MSLHVDSYGSGAPLLLIHGWGMHGGMWGAVTQQLAEHFRVLAVDLPGYGLSAGSGEWRVGSGGTALHLPLTTYHLLLDNIVDQLSVQFDGPLAVCGWSLGGQIALRWVAREPEKIKRLVLVASTPCFTMRDDWLFGMTRATLQQFAAELQQNHTATLHRFLALQVRGSKDERKLLASLRELLFSRGEPHPDALRSGLEILRDADLRSALPEIRQPALVIAGERDRLTPPQASHYLAQTLPDARLVEIKGAAHAPFLSHPNEFVKALMDFIKGDFRVG